MKLEIDLDTAQFRAAAQDAVRKLGANADLLIKEEGRLFLKEWRMRTPPFASGWGKPESARADRAAGEKAARGDIRRAATPLDADKIDNPRLKDAILKNDEVAIQAMADSGFTRFLKARQVVQETQFSRWHKGLRSARGRVTKDAFRLVIAGSAYLDYVRRVIDTVGFAKATFNRAAMALGARLPPYIAKFGPQGGYAEGRDPSFYILISGESNVPSAQTAANEAVSIRGKKLEAEMKRLMATFARTGKIPTRRKSFNQG